MKICNNLFLFKLLYNDVQCCVQYSVQYVYILSDPGYFRQLTIGGGGGGGGVALLAPSYDLENYSVNLHHIIHVHSTSVLGMFQLAFFKNSRF